MGGINDNLPNLDVYSFDPTKPEEGPSICEGPIPKLIHPNTDISFSFPDVFTLREKIYVLARYKTKKRPFYFVVFDPLFQSTKHLPPPPLPPPSYDSHIIDMGLSAWGHKLLKSYMFDTLEDRFYMFDTREEKWEDAKSETLRYGFSCVTEFQGFLIGVPEDVVCEEPKVVAYTLDETGIPEPYQVLHELGAIFCPFLDLGFFRMGQLDDDRIWFVCNGRRTGDMPYARVAVFRVSISKDFVGNPVLSADIEAAEFYQFEAFDSYVTSAFVMCHDFNKHDIEGKNMRGRLIPQIVVDANASFHQLK